MTRLLFLHTSRTVESVPPALAQISSRLSHPPTSPPLRSNCLQAGQCHLDKLRRVDLFGTHPAPHSSLFTPDTVPPPGRKTLRVFTQITFHLRSSLLYISLRTCSDSARSFIGTTATLSPPADFLINANRWVLSNTPNIGDERFAAVKLCIFESIPHF